MWEEEQKREVATRSRRRRVTSRDAKNDLNCTDAKLAPKKLAPYQTAMRLI